MRKSARARGRPGNIVRAPVLLTWALGLLLFSSASALPAETLHYEAEDGVLAGTSVATEIPGYSGRGYVTSFDQPDDSIELRITNGREGFYTLSIGYAASDPKINPVFVNGSIQENHFFPATQGFAKTIVGRVALHRGHNTVRIGTDWGQINVDYVELKPAPSPVPFQVSSEPVTPGASVEARQLLAELKNSFGKKILSGQQAENEERLSYIADATDGRAPVILGLDFLNYSGAYNRPDGQIEKAIDWTRNRHGIVSFSWHWFSPFGAVNEVWKSYSAHETTFDACRVLDESSPEYAAIIADIDLVAGQLKVLRDAHVPVLWRPLHESESGGFWWGAQGPEATRRLYQLMFDRFTRVHGLNNLIWVWTTSSGPDALQWYPGDAFVDIVGIDLYSPVSTRGSYLTAFDNVRQLYRGRKMIALCETDAVPEVTELRREGVDWLWFLVWDNCIERKELNPANLISQTYNDPRLVTLNRLGDANVPASPEPRHYYGVLQMAPEHLAAGRKAGLNVAVLPVSWDRFEPSPGTIDLAYVRKINREKEALSQIGYQIMLDPGIQYPPSWVAALPHGRYRNQFGDFFSSKNPGENIPNLVFSGPVRSALANYYRELFGHLGSDWKFVRLGGSKFGELNFPNATFAGHTNCYWAFDDLAQGQAVGLPADVLPCPVPGWLPGAKSPEHLAAKQFAEWYLDSLKKYQQWQIATVRAYYSGDLCLLYGGWGLRPGQLEAAIEKDLSGATGPERNGEVEQGFDWTRMIGAIADPRVVVYCTWLDATLHNKDLSDDLSADPARWSPAKWQSDLARKNPVRLRVWGENTGGNNRDAMRRTFDRIEQLQLMGVCWAFDRQLYANPNPQGWATFDDYANFIRMSEKPNDGKQVSR